MPKPAFYAVKNGRQTGVFMNWADCETQTKGYTGAVFKKFLTLSEAEAFVTGEPLNPSVSISEHSTSEATGRKRARSFVDNESIWDVVYSDGACKGNGKVGSVAGVGVWWGPDDPRNIGERCPGDQTNNRAELIAILRVLETTPFGPKPLLIKSDSQYSIDCVTTWLNNWKRNNFMSASGTPVKNKGIIRLLSAHLDARANKGHKVRLQYVKGHSGDVGNDGADSMANLGALLPEVEERDWDQLEKDLRKKMEGINQVAPIGIEGSDIRSKIRKVSSAPKNIDIRHADCSTVPQSKPSSVVVVSPTPKLLFPQTPAPVTSPSQSLVRNPPIPSLRYPNSSRIPASPDSSPLKFSSGTENGPGSSSRHAAMKVFAVAPPLIPIRAQDIDVNDYADCLDDDDWVNDLSD